MLDQDAEAPEEQNPDRAITIIYGRFGPRTAGTGEIDIKDWKVALGDCGEVPAFVVVCRSPSLRDILSGYSHPPAVPLFSAFWYWRWSTAQISSRFAASVFSTGYGGASGRSVDSILRAQRRGAEDALMRDSLILLQV